MRIAPIVLVLAISCGGSQKPAESADTSSLESKDNGGGSKEGNAAPAAASSSSGSSAAEAPAAPEEAAPAVPAHPSPSVTGAIDGKPFSPKVARTVGKVGKDGRITLAFDETHTDCSDSPPQSGDGTLTVLVNWEDGYKTDLSALKRATPKKANGEIAFSRAGAGGKKAVSPTFKPSGTLTVVKAPTGANSTGKVKIDLQSGDYMLAGDLDVLVCTAVK